MRQRQLLGRAQISLESFEATIRRRDKALARILVGFVPPPPQNRPVEASGQQQDYNKESKDKVAVSTRPHTNIDHSFVKVNRVKRSKS